MRKPNISRTGDKLQRLAFELEWTANLLKEAGKESASYGVRHCASELGDIGRRLNLNDND